jgi:molybdopterin molybdotransferase
MISVAEADRLLAPFRDLFPAESVPLEAAAGRILREDICADREYPAQHRSRMDGIAIAHEAWEKGARAFAVAGIARAGDPRTVLSRLSHSSQESACVEIMTGAPIPEGCDTVIPYEDLTVENGAARVANAAVVRRGQFVHARGSDCPQGHPLVASGVPLNAARAAVAASVGKSRLLVARRPRLSIVSTGDELVDVEDVPLPHQLRASNAQGLRALFDPWAETALYQAGDDPALLSAVLKKALADADMLLVSGGVSAGKFDAVPATLEGLGVEKVFHKIAQKPGKPLWFGKGPGGCLAFGLPGNPVSALVCARRFVLPLLWARLGWSAPPSRSVRLAAGNVALSRLTQYLPVRVLESEGVLQADPRPVNGSGDFAGLADSDGFAEFPPDSTTESHYPAGTILAYFPWLP